jgi:hypothetical protein
MIFIYAERRSKTRALHCYYLQNSLSFVENVWFEVKMQLRIVTTLSLEKFRIVCDNSLTNKYMFFFLAYAVSFVVAVLQTTGHCTA